MFYGRRDIMKKLIVHIEHPAGNGQTDYSELLDEEEIDGMDLDDYAEEIFTNICTYSYELVDVDD